LRLSERVVALFVYSVVAGGALLVAQQTPAQQAPAQQAPPQPAPPPPTIEDAWDNLIQTEIPQAKVDPTLTPPQMETKKTPMDDFLNHVFFESRSEYWRYSTSFTGQPTATGILNAPITGVFNPAGVPYPDVFQPNENRVYEFLDFGTRGWLSDRINTHFAIRYEQDLTHVDVGAPAQDILNTYPGSRRVDLLSASMDISGRPTDGFFAGTTLSIGRQYIYGAEVAALDGAAFTVNRRKYTVTVFGGRRFDLWGDPAQRAIGGANVTFRLGHDASIEYEGLWYIRGSNSIVLRKGWGQRWITSAYFRAFGSYPVDASLNGIYTSANGKTIVRLSFFEKLSSHDYLYDFTTLATNQNTQSPLLRLYLGPITPYSQFVVDGHRALTSRFRLGGTVWVRRLTNSADQGPYNVSFQDYRANAQIFPIRRWETFWEYHQHNSDRANPSNPIDFADVSDAGETSVKDLTFDLRHNFGEGRFSLNGGAYYRRIDLQDRFYYISGAHQAGWTAGGWWRLDQHTRLYADYNLDNDFFIFMPSIANSRVLHVGVGWKY